MCGASMAQTRNLSIYSAAVAIEETLVSIAAQLAGADAADAALLYQGLAEQVRRRRCGRSRRVQVTGSENSNDRDDDDGDGDVA